MTENREQPLLEVENCSKKFCRTLKRSLLYGVQDAMRECLGLSKSSQLRRDEFWALREVGFQLHRGECLGLIGPNGAGKSTLLKMISGLIKPDEGRITVRGQVGALIELNAGMNPLLTGRENIYVLGAMRGMTRRKIESKLEDILEFSELGEFLDMPVRSYSSGMKVRLGFSVAAQFEPDLLIIDEVLAVGDASFRLKSLSRTRELMNRTGVIFVSHAVSQVASLCDAVIVLDRGQIQYFSDPGEGTVEYMSRMARTAQPVQMQTEAAVLRDARILQPAAGTDDSATVVECGTEILFELDLEISPQCPDRTLAIQLQYASSSGSPVAITNSTVDGWEFKPRPGRHCIRLRVPSLNMGPGHYAVNFCLWTASDNRILARISNACPFVLHGQPTGGQYARILGDWSAKTLDCENTKERKLS